MGLLSKIFKPIKKVIKKVGKFIKRVAKKVGGAFGKMGILGHIGMMFLMPYAQSFWGTLGKFGTRLAQGTSLAGKGFGHLMRGIYHAGKSVGTVYRGVTEAIEGTLKWMGNQAGAVFGKPELFGKPWEGFEEWTKSVQNWGSEGWTGKDSIYDIGDPANYDTDIATGKASSVTPEIPTVQGGNVAMMGDPNVGSYDTTTGPTIKDAVDLPTVDVALEESSLLSRGKEILSEGFEKSKQQFKDTLVAAPSMVLTDTLKAGVQKAVIGEPTVNYGGQVNFSMGDTGEVLSMPDFGYNPDNLYSQGYSVGSPFMQAFGQDFLGEDQTWEMWINSGYQKKDSLATAYYNQ